MLTNSDDIAKSVKALRNYGSEIKYHHPLQGFNSRLDTLQATVLRAKLRRLDAWNEGRRQAAGRYAELLGEAAGAGKLSLPVTCDGNTHVWHLYVVRVAERDRVLADLHAAGIGAGIHYPVPIHLQGAFADLGKGPGSYPEAERAASEILSLPLFPQITADQQARVAEVLLASLG